MGPMRHSCDPNMGLLPTTSTTTFDHLCFTENHSITSLGVMLPQGSAGQASSEAERDSHGPRFLTLPYTSGNILNPCKCPEWPKTSKNQLVLDPLARRMFPTGSSSADSCASPCATLLINTRIIAKGGIQTLKQQCHGKAGAAWVALQASHHYLSTSINRWEQQSTAHLRHHLSHSCDDEGHYPNND